ncbi:MAG: PfkB family carbohydrate kinase [Verrucomicrobiae bacterium]|nr:PfkB family carbohydrate kinase [Verrucomicrobiae bacterium]
MNPLRKIKSVRELGEEAEKLRNEGKRVVHCHGVFDLVHVGHMRHFQEARRMGDVLVVTLTPDVHVNKGPDRPVFKQDLRAEALAMLESVDYVGINEWPTAEETLRIIRPHFYVKGPDYRLPSKDRSGNISREQLVADEVGAQLVVTRDITFSSSNLLNRHFNTRTKEVADFLQDFSRRVDPDQVLEVLDRVRSLKVLVVGETIIDDYHYCETMGKAGKEPILVARYKSSEQFAGGILAVANHLASFCDHPSMLTFLGDREAQEEFIRQKLNPSVKAHYLRLKDAPTLVKRRFIETYPFQKLFEVYVMGDGDVNAGEQAELCRELERLLPEFDAVIVTDYGHGMIGPEAVELLCSKAKFLAINTQVNAHNHGFNTISKYRRADYACVSEGEVRLEVRSRHLDVRDIVLQISRRLSCDRITITQGRQGSLCFDGTHFHQIPALTGHFVDRVGAGDAVLVVTSLCVAAGVPMETVGLIANAVGAQAVGVMGNRSAIDRMALIRHLEFLLK